MIGDEWPVARIGQDDWWTPGSAGIRSGKKEDVRHLA